MALHTSVKLFASAVAWSFGLLSFCSLDASAQNNETTVPCALFGNARINMTNVKIEDAVKVEVPTSVFEVTDDVYAVEVWCRASSSLRPENDDAVGDGRVIIASSGAPTTATLNNTMFLSEENVFTRVTTGDLDALSEKVEVYMCPKPNRELQSWTHGVCQLGIIYGDEAVDGLENAGIPRDCTKTDEVEPVAMCAYPGPDTVVDAKFARLGFHTDGSPVQYDDDGAPLPHVDDLPLPGVDD